jgi:hypothetical protein
MSNVKRCAVVRGTGVALVLLLGILGESSAWADSFGLTVSALAAPCINGAGQCNIQGLDVGPLQVNSITVNPIFSYATYGFPALGNGATALAQTEGTVRFGAITGSVFGSAYESCPSPPGSDCFEAIGAGRFDGFWNDTLTVTSRTLPAGSPVDLMATASIDAETHCTGVGASVQALAFLEAEPGTLGGVPPLVLSSNLCNSVFQQSQSETFTALVGESVFVQGQLSLLASGYALNSEPAVATVDPPASQFFINSLTPGSTYVTASGHSYSSTPEPGTLMLFGSGLLGLGTVLRRRSSGLA